MPNVIYINEENFYMHETLDSFYDLQWLLLLLTNAEMFRKVRRCCWYSFRSRDDPPANIFWGNKSRRHASVISAAAWGELVEPTMNLKNVPQLKNNFECNFLFFWVISYYYSNCSNLSMCHVSWSLVCDWQTSHWVRTMQV